VADISVPIEAISVSGAISRTKVFSTMQASLTLIHWPANCFFVEVNRSLLCLQTSLPPYGFILKQVRKHTPKTLTAKILRMREESFMGVTIIKSFTHIEFNIISNFCCNTINSFCCNCINFYCRNSMISIT
jgi:hypothetical protein